MKANEEGLTREERIMFALLSIILIVAIGVLVIKNFSDNERILIEDAPINEKGQDVDAEANLEPSKSENSLIEVAPEKVVNTKNNTSYKKAYLAAAPKEEKKKPSKNNNAIKEDVKDSQKEPIDIYNSWQIKETIVTKAYVNDIIKIDRNVLLSNGTEAESQLTIRQLIDETYMIVDISSGYLTLNAGTYKYYYTYGGITKELTLTVYDYLNPESATLLKLNDEIIDDSITQEKYETLKETLSNSKISLTENKINLSVNESSKENEIPIVLTLSNEPKKETIRSNILGISIANKENIWHQKLEDNQIVAWINLSILKTKNINLILEIDGINYVVSLNIEIIKNDDDIKDDNQDTEKNPTSEDTELNDELEKNPVPNPVESQEENNKDNNYENNIVIAVNQDTELSAQTPS